MCPRFQITSLEQGKGVEFMQYTMQVLLLHE